MADRSTLSRIRKQVLDANLALPRYGLVTFTWGNVSQISPERDYVVIKPSGVEYDDMTVDDMVVVDLEGNVLEGTLRPSSDMWTHIALYRAFSECSGICHTHSRGAAAWAQAGKDIPALGTTHADYFYGAVPCTRSMEPEEIASAYEKHTGDVIVETFHDRGIDPQAIPGVLVKSHGPFTWGGDADEAVHNAVVLEELAEMARMTLEINVSIPAMPSELLDKHYLRKHGKDAYYGQNRGGDIT